MRGIGGVGGLEWLEGGGGGYWTKNMGYLSTVTLTVRDKFAWHSQNAAIFSLEMER